MAARSAERFELASGELRATVSSLGATLRDYSVRGVPILWGSSIDDLPIGAAGQVLAPWPNRLDGGSYDFDGVHAVAALDEPVRNNAIHGLVRWLYWERVEQTLDRVKLRCPLAPQPGYPFPVGLAVVYALGESGLSVRVEAETNRAGGIPFGLGFHPYFSAGPAGLLGGRLRIDAKEHLLLDDRALPDGSEALQGKLGDLASASGLLLDDVDLDDCFKRLSRDESGATSVRFLPGSGDLAEVVVELDSSFDYVMCYTGGTLPFEHRRRAIAIEPMTCAPNAFNSGDGLLRVTPAEPFRASFSISATLVDR